VLREINQASVGKAAGTDGIMNEFYYHGGLHVAEVLQVLFQQISDQCKIPIEWYEANVCLIFKGKGSNQDAANYRPISLTVTARRLYERILKTDLEDAEKMLANTQGGFRTKRSTMQ
jgi:hypothetical protein